MSTVSINSEVRIKNLSNSLITKLSEADQALLLNCAKTEELHPGDVLSDPRGSPLKIYFPLSGTIALFVRGSSNPTSPGLAVGLIGTEGAAGLQAALGFGAGHLQLVVQSPGIAVVLDGLIAQRLVKRRRAILMHFTHYLWTVFDNIAYLSSRAHTQDVKLRLASWLLLSSERCAPDQLVLTHSQIALMLGVRRSSVSLAARVFKIKRYISYSRGKVFILNVSALQLLTKV